MVKQQNVDNKMFNGYKFMMTKRFITSELVDDFLIKQSKNIAQTFPHNQTNRLQKCHFGNAT